MIKLILTQLLFLTLPQQLHNIRPNIEHMTSKYLEDEGIDPNDIKKMDRPEETYTELIRLAINQSSRHRLFLSEIYRWITENYPYYKHSDQGWRNSIRHTLSTSKEFVRIKETRHHYTRGSEWCLSESPLGQWYIHLTHEEEVINEDDRDYSDSPASLSYLESQRVLQLKTLIPELSDSIKPVHRPRPVLLNLNTCPDYLLGATPHPELFVDMNRYFPSMNNFYFNTDSRNISTLNEANMVIKNDDTDLISRLLDSPLSRKSTPKQIDMENGLRNFFQSESDCMIETEKVEFTEF